MTFSKLFRLTAKSMVSPVEIRVLGADTSWDMSVVSWDQLRYECCELRPVETKLLWVEASWHTSPVSWDQLRYEWLWVKTSWDMSDCDLRSVEIQVLWVDTSWDISVVSCNQLRQKCCKLRPVQIQVLWVETSWDTSVVSWDEFRYKCCELRLDEIWVIVSVVSVYRTRSVYHSIISYMLIHLMIRWWSSLKARQEQSVDCSSIIRDQTIIIIYLDG